MLKLKVGLNWVLIMENQELYHFMEIMMEDWRKEIQLI